jgi:imidazolonepropionase-like amidohydrolase
MRNQLVGYVLRLALLLVLVACGPQPTLSPSPTVPDTATVQPVPADALVITNGMVIDGTGADPIPDGIVVIRENRIMAVGRAADFSVPPQTNVIDAEGGTIMPGIINAHVHAVAAPAGRSVFLHRGVTSVCDMGYPLSTIPFFEEDHSPLGLAARGFRAGPIITAPGGYQSRSPLSYEVATPEEARAAVADLLDRGVDYIKIALEPGNPQDPWPTLELEEVQAIVEEAHARGVLVRAHATGPGTLGIALQAGVDVIEHGTVPPFQPALARHLLENRSAILSEYEIQLARMVDQGVAMVPTLDAGLGRWYERPDLTEEQKVWTDFVLEIVGRFHTLGGVVALGNDYPIRGERMPMREMELLLAAGLSPMQVIEAGTRHAAQVCGHGDELGTLEPGKLADVIVVDGDPLTEIEAMNRVIAVIRDGQVAYTSE